MARELLKHDKGTTTLVEITKDDREAVYFNRPMISIRLSPFDATGMDGERTRAIKHGVRHIEAWVRRQGWDGFARLHPQYRWILEM